MGENGRYGEHEPLLSKAEIASTPVYPIIHMIKNDMIKYALIISIHRTDTPLTFDALTAPDLTYTLIRPLHEKYSSLQRGGNMSIVFCLLLNRAHFRADENMSTAPVSRTRAELCELLAIRTLRDYGDDTLTLAHVVTTAWPVFNGADEEVLRQAQEDRDDLEERVGNAIELAIVGKAKRFIKCSPCQKVIDAIWSGKCVYQAESSHSILSDTYKRTPIHYYDPHKAPLLDHYRLKVPSVRAVLEFWNFVLLFILFVVAIEYSERDHINTAEIVFMVYALGFSLEKFAAMQEHGIRVYTKGTWNGFDIALVSTYLVYLFLRLYGQLHNSKWARSLGIDLLALIACLLFPRLAFVTLKDNLMVLALRAMIVQFLLLMMIAAFCFCGFLYALWTLSRNEPWPYSATQIAWWMLDIWFGLDASGFEKATNFHPYFGPVLMVTYACLSNTLLLTVLVSILTNTFATISEDALAEAMFRRAVSTIEGVKADSLFSYHPPINLLAVCVMFPLSFILTPRWFHKVNVFCIRLTSFPILLGIALYERQAKKHGTTTFSDTLSATVERIFDALPRQITRLSIFEGFAGADGGIEAIFEIEEELGTSALDTRSEGEVENGPPQTSNASGALPASPQHRRLSSSTTATKRRPSTPLQSPTAVMNPAPNQPPLRARVNSMTGPQNFTSPLAQIFQPLVVDDDLMEEDDNASEASSPPQNMGVHFPSPPGVSYGPASRRRLSSMHRPRMESGVRRFPILGRVVSEGSGNGVLSESPEQAGGVLHGREGEGPTVQQPTAVVAGSPLGSTPLASARDVTSPTPSATAQQVVDTRADTGAAPGWVTRLDKMEARQQRIEDMLQRLVQGMATKV
ncbi:hypothetical protein K523DRAFT_370042 [Schizophyllum commune Tattone D]|nr:hypothetical protein K523DRAFT_370042 [Schizophyllum commune Tattone D]